MKKKLIFVDLFCGAGGTTTGIHNAIVGNNHVAKVLACINHDEVAIESHYSNHKFTKHFTEDIRLLDLTELRKMVLDARALNEDAKICLWASLECTNFSKAKGGQPRDADSRTLAEHLFRYIRVIDPEYIFIENVEEFMSWGPLDENGKPVSKQNGRDYIRWCNKVQSFGYSFQSRLLNSADYGAYTSRKRLFIVFGKLGLPVQFPSPTHAKKPLTYGMFGQLKKWKPVKDVLDLHEHGNSIFGRKKDLSEKTMARIYAGLIKYIAGGKDAFILKYNSINKTTGKHVPPTIDEPCPTIAAQGRLGICTAEHFIAKYYSGKPEGKVIGVDGPAGAIKTIDGQSLISTEFIAAYYSNGDNTHSVDNPAPTIRTKDGAALITSQFLDKNYSGSANHQPLTKPAGTILTKDKYCLISSQFIEIKHSQGKQDQSIDTPSGSLTTVTKENLITAEQFIIDTQYNNTGQGINSPLNTITANRKYHYLLNPQWALNSGASIDGPCFTIIARMDKMPPYIVTSEEGYAAIEIYETDSEYTRKIKEFMALYGIVDIKMRMLKVNELLKIQGFPEGYILKGTQAEQKKFIGNSVVPVVAQKLIECIAECLYKEEIEKVA